MKILKKALSAVTAGALTLSLAAAGSTAMMSTVNAADLDSMTAMQLVEDMGTGWNLGNSFDCTNTWTNPLTVEAIETAWQNPVTTQSMIDAIAFYGFNTVRIPVTWFQMTSGNTINEEYLARIKEVVDYCYANDLCVIINMHHDGLSGNWLYNGTGAQSQFTAMWTQIANYFADYDRHLAFEGWNEIDWDYSTQLTMSQAFVDAVRATGGNNADRLLIIPGKSTNFDATVSTSYQLPTDSANMLAVDIHYYDPTTYTVYSDDDDPWVGTSQTPVNTWGTDAEVAEVKNDFLQLQSRFTSQGIPVIIGEYGVENYNKPDDQGRILFTETVASEAYNADGICACLWDSSNGGDMKYFDRVSQSWLNAEFGEFYKELSGGTYVNEDGLILTDRITMTSTSDSEVLVDISAFKGKAVIKEVIWSVNVEGLTDAGYYGLVGFQANVTDDATQSEHNYAYQGVSIANESDVYTTGVAEGWLDGNDEAYVGYSLDYDYIKIAVWYIGSDGTAPTVTMNPEVTIVFEDAIWVTPDYEIPEEEETTEEVTTEEETTEEVTTEEVTDEPTTEDPGETTVTYGDVNCDGTVNIMDVIELSQSFMGVAQLTTQGAANADVDKSGTVVPSDTMYIAQSLVKLVTLPVEG